MISDLRQSRASQHIDENAIQSEYTQQKPQAPLQTLASSALLTQMLISRTASIQDF